MKPKAPDPNGPQPEDWPEPRHWLAYTAWAQGTMTREAIANHAGYSRGHLSRLVASWRKTYDVTDLQLRQPGITPENQRKGVEAHAVKSRLTWTARREGLGDDLGDDIEALRQFVRALVDHYSQPERLTAMTPAEAIKAGRDLVWMLREMAKVADQTSGIPDATRALAIDARSIHFGETGPEDPNIERDLLDDLLGSGSGTPQDVLEAIELLAQGHLVETAPGSLYDAVTEIQEVEPA